MRVARTAAAGKARAGSHATVNNVIARTCFLRNQIRPERIALAEMKGKCVMWERFSTSGLAGAYLDELLASGVKAHMQFRPRRAMDPYPFVVSLAEEGERDVLRSRAYRIVGERPDP